MDSFHLDKKKREIRKAEKTPDSIYLQNQNGHTENNGSTV